jgi:hypothetical protein
MTQSKINCQELPKAEISAWAEALGIDAASFGLRPEYVRPPRHETYHWYFIMPGECLLSGHDAPRLRCLPSELSANPDLPKVYWGKAGISHNVKLWIPKGQAAWVKQRAAELGVVYMANGEKAVYAALALGLPAFCTATGEGSIKATTAQDVQAAFGAEIELIQLVDNDEPGRKAAQTMGQQALKAGLRWKALDMGSLPNMPPKGDLVEAIGMAGHDLGRLTELLASAKVIPLVVQPEPERLTLVRRYEDDMDFEARKQALIENIRATIHQRADGKVSQHGQWLNFRSLLRDDHRASAGFNLASGVYHDFATGDKLSAWQVAKALGIDAPKPTRTAHKRRKDAPQQAEQMSIGSSAQALMNEQAWIAGLAPVTPWAVKSNERISVKSFNAQYVNEAITFDDLVGRVNVIQSPTGSGKTEAVLSIIKRAEEVHQEGIDADRPLRVLVITHRVSLSKAAARRLSLELYQDASYWLKSADKLSITLDSLHKLSDDNGAMPAFDLVIVDEIEQVGFHVGRKSTLGRKARLEAFKALTSVLEKAHTVIGLDAHAGRLTAGLLASVKQQQAIALGIESAHPVHWWKNEQRPALGRLTMTSGADGTIAKGLAHAQAEARRQGGAPVAIGFDSRKRAEEVHQAAQALGLKPLLVTANTQDDEQVKAFLANPNEELGRYDLLLFSPSISTGFDIQAPTAGVYIISEGYHLRPNDVLQAARRFRRAAMTYVYIRATSGIRKSAKALASDAQQAALLAEQGLPEPELPIDKPAIARLSALNAQGDSLIALDRANNLRAVFWGLSSAEGFDVGFEQVGAAPDLRAALKAHREALDAQERADTLALSYALSRDEYRALQMTGKATQDDRRAALRGAIETARYGGLSAALGAPLMDALSYDLLSKPQSRSALRRMSTSLSPASALAQDDQERRVAWQERHLHRANNAALYDLLALMAAHQGEEQAIGKDDFEGLASAWQAAHKTAIAWADKDAGQAPEALSDAPIAAARRFLRRYGISLKSKQVQQAGQRKQAYWLELSEEQAQMWAWADERNQWAAMAQAQAQGLPQPVLKTSETIATLSEVFRAIGQAAQQAAQMGHYRPMKWPSDGAMSAA